MAKTSEVFIKHQRFPENICVSSPPLLKLQSHLVSFHVLAPHQSRITPAEKQDPEVRKRRQKHIKEERWRSVTWAPPAPFSFSAPPSLSSSAPGAELSSHFSPLDLWILSLLPDLGTAPLWSSPVGSRSRWSSSPQPPRVPVGVQIWDEGGLSRSGLNSSRSPPFDDGNRSGLHPCPPFSSGWPTACRLHWCCSSYNLSTKQATAQRIQAEPTLQSFRTHPGCCCSSPAERSPPRPLPECRLSFYPVKKSQKRLTTAAEPSEDDSTSGTFR